MTADIGTSLVCEYMENMKYIWNACIINEMLIQLKFQLKELTNRAQV